MNTTKIELQKSLDILNSISKKILKLKKRKPLVEAEVKEKESKSFKLKNIP